MITKVKHVLPWYHVQTLLFNLKLLNPMPMPSQMTEVTCLLPETQMFYHLKELIRLDVCVTSV